MAHEFAQKIINKIKQEWNPGIFWLGVLFGICEIAITLTFQLPPYDIITTLFIAFILSFVIWIGTENNSGIGGMASFTLGIALGMFILADLLSSVIDEMAVFTTNATALLLAFAFSSGIYKISDWANSRKVKNKLTVS